MCDLTKEFGNRLKKARNARGLSRDDLSSLLTTCPRSPNTKEAFTVERLKKWEYGTNAVDVRWIPAICDTLSVDVGYLFGDYEEYTREAADVVKLTGLSEAAVNSILDINKENMLNPGGTYTDILKAISTLLDENYWDQLLDYWRRISAFLFAKGGDFVIPLSTGYNIKKDDVLGSLLLANNAVLLSLKHRIQYRLHEMEE